MIRIIKLFIIAVGVFAACVALFFSLPAEVKYEIEDSFGRLSAPKLSLSLEHLSGERQDEIIKEYKQLGYKLKCFGNLQPKEKIGKYNDYLCWALIKSAFDDIPARHISFFFYKERLVQVRIEFPSSSFTEVIDYLSEHLDDNQRLDNLPGQDFGVDNYGKPLMVWKGDNGVIVTSEVEASSENMIVLWISKEILVLDLLDNIKNNNQ